MSYERQPSRYCSDTCWNLNDRWIFDFAKLLGASAPAFMQDENGREVVKLLTAVLIATTVRTAPEFMENSDNIAKVCELQITHSTDMLSTRLMSTSREQLQALAALGIDIARSR